MRSLRLLSERPISLVILVVRGDCRYMVEPRWNPVLGLGARIVVASLAYGDVLTCLYCSFKYWSPPFACTSQKMHSCHSSLVHGNLSTENLRTSCCCSKIRTTALSIVIFYGRHLALGLTTVSSRARASMAESEKPPNFRSCPCSVVVI